MRPVLRPGACLVRRDADHLQVGTTPGGAYVLREQPGMVDLLRAIDGLRTDVELAEQTSGSPADLLGALHAASVVLDSETWLAQPTVALRSEARHLASAGLDRVAIEARMHARAVARVEISFDGETRALAQRVAAMLAESGVQASLRPITDPTLVVVLSIGPCPRVGLELLADARIAYLPVSVDEDRVRVGPLVRPGATPCVTCDDHQRSLWDPAWPVLLAQLDRPLAPHTPGQAHALSAVTAATAVTTTAAEVVAACEGGATGTHGAVLVVGPGPAEVATQPVPFSDRCGCQILTVTSSTSSGVPARPSERV